LGLSKARELMTRMEKKHFQTHHQLLDHAILSQPVEALPTYIPTKLSVPA
jgi:hypothetical protein